MDEERVRGELAGINGVLVAARRGRGGLSQERLAGLLGVSAESVRVWELEGWVRDGPTLVHLIGRARVLGMRVVIIDGRGDWVYSPLGRELGERQDAFEMRCLLAVLRGLRLETWPRLTQSEVARLAGVDTSSIKNWERQVSPPRAVGFMRWVLALGCRVELRTL
ncbi:DNA-binding transcriptional regulator YiaG [Catenulispora sp. GAS73]|uniref:hypothetical protein n=1 Tax=Catenulispora sp. GAS73 TaxID=3156269 RepID=UPI0035187E87